jgi:hypothetical protein
MRPVPPRTRSGPVDEDKLQMQLHIIRVTYRAESRRLRPDALHAVRLRALEILDRLEREADGDSARRQIAEVRAEIGSANPR